MSHVGNHCGECGRTRKVDGRPPKGQCTACAPQEDRERIDAEEGREVFCAGPGCGAEMLDTSDGCFSIAGAADTRYYCRNCYTGGDSGVANLDPRDVGTQPPPIPKVSLCLGDVLKQAMLTAGAPAAPTPHAGGRQRRSVPPSTFRLPPGGMPMPPSLPTQPPSLPLS